MGRTQRVRRVTVSLLRLESLHSQPDSVLLCVCVHARVRGAWVRKMVTSVHGTWRTHRPSRASGRGQAHKAITNPQQAGLLGLSMYYDL